jgi:hypothetical protein
MYRSMAVLGLGIAVSVAPLTTTVLSAADSQHAGTALNNAISRIAAKLAIDAATHTAVGAVLYRLFIICANPKPAARNLAMKLARHAVQQSGDEMAGQSDIEWSEDVLDE